MDWGSILLQPDWLSRIDRLARRRFGEPGLAEEAAAFVIEALSRDDWARCRAFEGKSSPETYAYTLINRALEEFSRQRFGRARPPAWLRREGPLWVSVWKRVCMERQLTQTVIDGLSGAEGREASAVETAIVTIKARMPWCGQSAREIPLSYFEGDDGEAYSAQDAMSETLDVAETDREDHYEMLLLALGFAFETPADSEQRQQLDERSRALAAHYRPRFERFAQLLEMTDEERVILSMVYREGVKKNQVAASLNMPAHQPGRILKRVVQRIGEALREANLDVHELSLELRK